MPGDSSANFTSYISVAFPTLITNNKKAGKAKKNLTQFDNALVKNPPNKDIIC